MHNGNGDVYGKQLGSDTIRDISRDIRNYFKPECYFEVNVKSTSDEKRFIEVVLNGNQSPYSSDGKYFK